MRTLLISAALIAMAISPAKAWRCTSTATGHSYIVMALPSLNKVGIGNETYPIDHVKPGPHKGQKMVVGMTKYGNFMLGFDRHGRLFAVAYWDYKGNEAYDRCNVNGRPLE